MTQPSRGEPETIYVVYQMGKVGSSSVFESMRRAELGTVHKVHYLADEGISKARQRYRDFGGAVSVPYEETTCLLRRLLADRTTEILWKVVTLVREPIARDVSAYIQMVDLLNPELVIGEPQVGRIARAAAAQFIGFDQSTNYTCRWFDDEFSRVFGIDVFAYPFDRSKGWQRILAGNVDVLLIRLEDLDQAFAAAMLEFTGRRVPLLYRSSRSPQKLQAAYRQDVYRQILGRLRISERACERVYRSRYARHFYSDAELELFRNRWSRPRGQVKERTS
jgi:hypothetical protein